MAGVREGDLRDGSDGDRRRHHAEPQRRVAPGPIEIDQRHAE